MNMIRSFILVSKMTYWHFPNFLYFFVYCLRQARSLRNMFPTAKPPIPCMPTVSVARCGLVQQRRIESGVMRPATRAFFLLRIETLDNKYSGKYFTLLKEFEKRIQYFVSN